MTWMISLVKYINKYKVIYADINYIIYAEIYCYIYLYIIDIICRTIYDYDLAKNM